MKVETPQLRWHQIINPQSQKDVGANGPILSCSLLSVDSRMGVLATAGNAEVNLWRVRFTENQARSASSGSVDMHGLNASEDDKTQHRTSQHILVQPQQQQLLTTNTTTMTDPAADQQSIIPTEHTHIDHIVTLSRGTNERSINAVKFSPSGQHLVAAGDGGAVVVYSLPHSTTNNATNPMAFWSTVEKETDLHMKIIFNQSDDVMDVAWSADSKRFTLCSLDHTLTVWEAYSHTSSGGGGAAITAGDWRNVHRSAKDHTHYIQGVAYDPKGVYLASMGSDRMVKVYSRKGVKENLLNEGLAKYTLDETTDSTKQSNDTIEDHHQRKEDENKNAILQNKVLPEILTNSSFSLQNKVKTLKFLNDKPVETSTVNSTSTIRVPPLDPNNAKDSSSPSKSNTNPSLKRHHMFADELTLGSFFRRLSFTTDGAFLVVPAALWHGRKDLASSSSKNNDAPLVGSPTSVVSNGIDKLSESSFATYLFARHHFDQPYKVLTGLGKPSVVVRASPVLFQLPRNNNTKSVLPYRSLFAVLTYDSVIIYDTFHNQPLALARGLHYAGLTDAAWSSDGRTLFVTSSDGYISILSFMEGELGDVYEIPTVNIVETSVSISETDKSSVSEIVKPSNISPAVAPEVYDKTEKNVVENTLIARKKPALDIKPDLISEKKKVTFGDPLDDRSVDKKRSSNDALESLIDPKAVSINVLVAKKKKKVNSPATSIVTM